MTCNKKTRHSELKDKPQRSMFNEERIMKTDDRTKQEKVQRENNIQLENEA